MNAIKDSNKKMIETLKPFKYLCFSIYGKDKTGCECGMVVGFDSNFRLGDSEWNFAHGRMREL